jgi:hypothetical protein
LSRFDDVRSAYLHVMNEDLPEPVRQHVASSTGRTVADVRHLVLALELPAHPVVDTPGLPPVTLREETRTKV